VDESVLQIKTKIVSWHTADSKRVKQEVNGKVILPYLVFPGLSLEIIIKRADCQTGFVTLLLALEQNLEGTHSL
jgi:hypothetical protein